MNWNGYTFTSFVVDIAQHTWILVGNTTDNVLVNILTAGNVGSMVSIYSESGLSFFSGGELKFQIDDVLATTVVVNNNDLTTRDEIINAIYQAWG